MMIAIIIGIALLSVGLAYLSLRSVQKGLGEKETHIAKESLKKERVIFHSSDASSSSSS